MDNNFNVCIGTPVFFITNVCDDSGEEKDVLFEGEITDLGDGAWEGWFRCRYNGGLTYWHQIKDIREGKVVFLDRTIAEARLFSVIQK